MISSLSALWQLPSLRHYGFFGERRVHPDVKKKVYTCLLVARPDADGFLCATPSSHVGFNQLWTSCWKGLHPGWLVVTRFVSLAVMAGFLSWDIVEWDASIFVYYTEWTFVLVMVYFALGTVISAYGCWVYSTAPPPAKGGENSARDEFLGEDRTVNYRQKDVKGKIKLQSRYVKDEFQQRAGPGFWGYLMQTIDQTCGGVVVLTDIVSWLIIVPFLSNSHLGLNMLMGCMHTLNAVFLILDTLLNSLHFPWFRIAYFVQWSCLYIVFQWILHACGFTWWPYPFLELDSPWAPLWYFSLTVVHIPCYGIYALIVKAKNSILPRLFPHAFVKKY